MQLPTVALSLLALITSTYGCAHYLNCKCHDVKDGLQNNNITEQACNKYKEDNHAVLRYKVDPHHQCVGSPLDNGAPPRSMQNCDWDKACKSFGPQYYQWCWEKLW